jgi:hypothetical protein
VRPHNTPIVIIQDTIVKNDDDIILKDSETCRVLRHQKLKKATHLFTLFVSLDKESKNKIKCIQALNDTRSTNS